MNLRSVTRSLVEMGLLVFSGMVGAQSSVPTANPAAAGSATTGLEEIIVTSRKVAEQAQDVPLAMSVFSSERIRDLDIRNFEDLALSTPNFSISEAFADPNSLLLTIRGQSGQDTVLTIDSPVGVYVDGVNIPVSYGLKGSLLDIDRIEVLKGPQGTLYGKNTTGGAVSIITKQPDLQESNGYVDLQYGNFDFYQASGAVNMPIISDKAAVRVVGEASGHSGYGTDAAGHNLEELNERTLRATLLVAPIDGVTVSLAADYYSNHGGGPIVKLTEVNAFPSTTAGTPIAGPGLVEIAAESGLLPPTSAANLAAARAIWSKYVGGGNFYDTGGTGPETGDVDTYGTSANVAVDLAPSIQLKSISAVRWLNRNAAYDLDATPFAILPASETTTERNVSEELQVAKSSHVGVDWVAGLYFNRETGNEGVNFSPLTAINPDNPGIQDGDVVNRSWAAYGQANYAITDTVKVTGGIRWTEEKKELITRNRSGSPTGTICDVPVQLQRDGECSAALSNTFVDPSYLFSVDWKPAENTLLYAKTAHSFKGGGQNYRGTTVDTLASFKPETVTDYEIGLKSDYFNHRLRVNADVFYENYHDIQRTTFTPELSTLITNAAAARIKGGELEITAVPIDGLTLSAAGGYTDAKYISFVDALGNHNNQDFGIPKANYTLSAIYKRPVGIMDADMLLSTNWNWRASQNFEPAAVYSYAVTQPAYGLLGARASLLFFSSRLEVAGFAKNILAKQYYVSAVNYDVSLGFDNAYAGTPRTYGAEIRYKWGNQ